MGTQLDLRALTASGLLLAALSAADSVRINERYSRKPEDGVYRPSPNGQAMGLARGPLDYAAPFRRGAVESGSLSVVFRPLLGRRDYRHLHDAIVTLTDGENSIALRLFPWSQPKPELPPTQRIGMAVKPNHKGAPREGWMFSHSLGQDSHTRYQHVLFTWDRERVAAFVNGECVKRFEYQQKKHVLWPSVLDGRRATLSCRGYAYLDDVAVLDRALNDAEAQAWSGKGKAPADIDKAVFHAAFDGTRDARSACAADGDVVRLIAVPGRPEATFHGEEETELTFVAFNATSQKHSARLRLRVDDIDKKLVLEKRLAVELPAGSAAPVRVQLEEMTVNGLFWAHADLLDGETVLASAVVPFARTLALDPGRHGGDVIRTGHCAGQVCAEFSTRVYAKWHQVHYEYWRDLEYEPGKWTFDRMDLRVDNLVKSGRIPMVMLFGTPDWYVSKYPEDKYSYSYRMRTPPDDIEPWKTYVRTVAERYRGRVRYYILWSCEAYFLGSNFRGTSEQQVALIRAAAEILHAIDPEIRIIPAFGGYDRHQIAMAKGTADCAYGYCASQYHLTLVEDKYPLKVWEKGLAALRKANAPTRIFNLEYGVYALGRTAVNPDGRPMTAAEVKENRIWEALPEVYHRRGKPFPDWYANAARQTRVCMLSAALDQKTCMVWSTGATGAFSDITYRLHAPSVSSVAYANASGLLAGTSFVKRLTVGPPEQKAYLFRQGDGFLIAAFNDGAAAEVLLNLAGSERPRIIDLYGNQTPFTRIGPLARFSLTPNRPLYIVDLDQSPGEARPIVELTTPGAVLPGRNVHLKTVLSNPLQEPLKGSLSFRFPTPFTGPPDSAISLAPGESREIDIPLAVPDEALGSYEIEARFATESDALGALNAAAPLRVSPWTHITLTRPPPLIDGDLGEWGDEKDFPIHLNKVEQLLKGVPYTRIGWPRFDWNNVADLSAHAAVRMDDKNLYIAVRVHDDKLANLWFRSTNPARAYDGDSIELFLDARRREDQGSPTFSGACYHLIFVPPLGDYRAAWWRVQKPRGGALPGLAAASKVLADGYTFEIRIPFDSLPDLERTPGCDFGLDIGASDNEEFFPKAVRGAKAALRWTGASSSGDPSLFGRLLIRE